jgi:hypothetical protein
MKNTINITPHPYPLPQGERDIEMYLPHTSPSPLGGEACKNSIFCIEFLARGEGFN